MLEKCKQGCTFFIYQSSILTSGKSKGALKSLKNLWQMWPPPTGPNTWLGGSGTSDSQFTAFWVLAARSGGDSWSLMRSMTKYIVLWLTKWCTILAIRGASGILVKTWAKINS